MRILCVLFLLTNLALAEDKPLLAPATEKIASPDLKSALGQDWKIVHGTWVPKDGILSIEELPENKHVAVLWHEVGLNGARIECDFRLNGSPAFLVGCDGQKHVGRVVVKKNGIDIAEDSVAPSHVIASLNMPVKADEWHHLVVEWSGDEMAASMDGKELKAKHAYLANPKVRSWFAVAGKTAEVKNLVVQKTQAKF
jgi:hypothetical protein